MQEQAEVEAEAAQVSGPSTAAINELVAEAGRRQVATEFSVALGKLIAEARREGAEEERKRRGAPWFNIFGPSATTTTYAGSNAKPTPEPEKPLRVRVAEALGWTNIVHDPAYGTWTGDHPEGIRVRVPYYDTSWFETGPLIEKYGIKIEYLHPPALHSWHAWFNETGHLGDHAFDSTPLKAVCSLILLLKSKGKL